MLLGSSMFNGIVCKWHCTVSYYSCNFYPKRVGRTCDGLHLNDPLLGLVSQRPASKLILMLCRIVEINKLNCEH